MALRMLRRVADTRHQLVRACSSAQLHPVRRTLTLQFRGMCSVKSGSLSSLLDERKQVSNREPQVSFRNLLSVLKDEKVPMALATVGILGASLASMAIPDAVGTIIDALNNLEQAQASSVITSEMLRMLGIFSGGALATYIKISQIEIIGQRVSADLRKRLFRSLIQQETGFFDANKSGELANRLSTDVHEVAEHLVQNVSSAVTATVTAGVAGAYMLHISPSLTAITFAVVPAMAIGGAWYGRKVRQLSQDLLTALAKSTQMAMERFSQILIVKSYNGESRAVNYYSGVIDDTFRLAKRLATAEGGYLSVIFMTSSVSLLGVLWFGGHMVMTGDISVGALASFGMYAYQLGDSVAEITEGVAGTLRAQGSAARLFHLLHRKSSETQPPVTFVLADEAIKGPIVFHNVHFAYPTRPTKSILTGLNLTLQPGKTVGITGSSGCGKSTLGFLLQKMYPPNAGAVTINGRNIESINTQWWRDQVSFVSQDAMLFSGSIAANISYGAPGASQEEIEWAARSACAHDFIMSLPDQYNTILGERGVALSGGQRQRITIARAILADPKILILDEATSALDIENERLVQESLKKLMKGRTCLVISHHPLVLQETDRVLVLDKGQVVQDGPFHELIQDADGQLISLLDYTEDRYEQG